MLEPRGAVSLLVTPAVLTLALGAFACTEGAPDDPLGSGVPAQLPMGAIGAVGADIPAPSISAATMGNPAGVPQTPPAAEPPPRKALHPPASPLHGGAPMPAPTMGGAASAAPPSKGTTL